MFIIRCKNTKFSFLTIFNQQTSFDRATCARRQRNVPQHTDSGKSNKSIFKIRQCDDQM